MSQHVTQRLDAALDTAAERIAEGLLADIDSALANPAVRAVVEAERLDAEVFNAVLRAVAAKFAAFARRPRRSAARKPAAAPG